MAQYHDQYDDPTNPYDPNDPTVYDPNYIWSWDRNPQPDPAIGEYESTQE